MKRFILLAVCAFSFLTMNAQRERYYVYGVDFSPVVVYGADESAYQFEDAFISINQLLIQESNKYDFSKVVRNRVFVNVDPMLKKLSNTDYSNLITFSPYFDKINVGSIVKRYKLPEREGVGIVMIAKLLDKKNSQGIYELVLFDIASRKIIAQREVVGKARGFGLRNYWAGSVYDVIKNTTI